MKVNTKVLWNAIGIIGGVGIISQVVDTVKVQIQQKRFREASTSPRFNEILNYYKDSMTNASRLSGKVRELEEKRIERECFNQLELERKKLKSVVK